MDGVYWMVTVETARGVEAECAFDFTAGGARSQIERRLGSGSVTGEPVAMNPSWFHYEPLMAKPRNVAGRETASLREQFWAGGRIGCEVDGLEMMFTPDLLPQPEERGEGDDARTVYGKALARVRNRPDFDFEIELEGLDDAHLIDRLSGEAVRCAGRARLAAAKPGPAA